MKANNYDSILQLFMLPNSVSIWQISTGLASYEVYMERNVYQRRYLHLLQITFNIPFGTSFSTAYDYFQSHTDFPGDINTQVSALYGIRVTSVSVSMVISGFC